MSTLQPSKKIILAVVVGIVAVAGAWWLKPAAPEAPMAARTTPAASVQVARPLQRPYIDITDSDGNGVPDWQEALQNTEPLTLTDDAPAYEEPDTLTDQFALEFFEQYMRGEQYGAFGTSPEELIQNSGDALARQATDDPISRSEIDTSPDTSDEALAAYGERIATILIQHASTDTEPELEIIDRAIRRNDASELEKLDPIITVYENLLADTLQLAVPQTYTTEHLILLNAYQAILNDIKAMRASFDDPMRALLRVQRYQDDAAGLNNAIVGLYNQLLSDDVNWEQNSPVWQLIDIQ